MKKFKRIYIEITNICNLSCKFCPKTFREKKEMSVLEFAQICEKLKGRAHSYALHVLGEPLTHSNLEQILDICDSEKMSVHLTTNGTLLEKNKDIFSRHSSVKKLSVSLHSFKQNNLGTEKEFEEFCNNLIELCGYIQSTSSCAINLKLWDNEAAEKLQRTGYSKLKDNFTFSVEREFVWPVNERDNIENNLTDGYCLGLKNQIAVLADGSVVPCCLDSEGEMVLGNIFESTLDEILFSKRAKAISDGFAKGQAVEKLCRRCTYKNRFNKYI